MRRTTRRASAALLGLLSLSIMTACSDDDGGATGTTAPPSTAAATTSSAGSTSPTDPASTDSDQCTTDDLTGELFEVEPAAGQRYAQLVLTNSSAQPCTIIGYGGAQLVATDGTDLPTDLFRDTSVAVAPVPLQPGESAQSQLQWSVVPGEGDDEGAQCQPAPATLAVIPPDQTTALDVPWTLGPVCEQGRIVQQPYVNAM